MKMRSGWTELVSCVKCAAWVTGMVWVAGLSGCSSSGGGGAPLAGLGAASRSVAEQAAPAPHSAGSYREAASDASAVWNKPVPKDRPGLATGWGRELKVGGGEPMRPFVRASAKAAGTDVIYYNDREGVEAMTSYKWRSDGWNSAAGGLVEWGIKSGWGMAPTWRSDGRRFVVGELNQEYSIVVRNCCKSRVEVVLSVDGLSVLDGRPASMRSGGHVIDPGKTVEVKGFRTGTETVAAFRFSTVGGSYANLKHGNTRNVGVIGLAVFAERGFDPWTWMPGEVKKRDTARPFATAP